jgi:hypothetical protein
MSFSALFRFQNKNVHFPLPRASAAAYNPAGQKVVPANPGTTASSGIISWTDLAKS